MVLNWKLLELSKGTMPGPIPSHLGDAPGSPGSAAQLRSAVLEEERWWGPQRHLRWGCCLCKLGPQPLKQGTLVHVDGISLGTVCRGFYQILSGFLVPQQIRCPQGSPRPSLWVVLDPM